MSKSEIQKADIVISSYLGDNEDLQKRRLANHLKQRTILREQFPELEILSICSAYPLWAKRKIADFECIHKQNRMHKFEKHNLVFRSLYQSKSAKSILLLDDDTVPTVIEDLPSQQPIMQLNLWLKYPTLMPCSCIYFSVKGIYGDMFYRSRPPGLRTCPTLPSGCACLVRNDLKVLFIPNQMEQDGIRLADDAVFRIRCAAMGKEVLKDFGLFVKFFQNSSDEKGSSWHRSRESRKECLLKTKEALLKFYPWVFMDGSSTKRLRPFWQAKGTKLRTLITAGLLDYGYSRESIYPTEKMKAVWEHEHKPRKGLLDLV